MGGNLYRVTQNNSIILIPIMFTTVFSKVFIYVRDRTKIEMCSLRVSVKLVSK